jgi:hypothetical protein
MLQKKTKNQEKSGDNLQNQLLDSGDFYQEIGTKIRRLLVESGRLATLVETRLFAQILTRQYSYFSSV